MLPRLQFLASVDQRPVAEIKERAKNMRPAYIAAIGPIVAELQRAFPTQGANIGAPWAPLRASTVRRKRSSKILEWEGKLQASFLSRLQQTVYKNAFMVKLPRRQVKRMAPAVLGNDKQKSPPRELFGWNRKMSDILFEEVIKHLGLPDE